MPLNHDDFATLEIQRAIFHDLPSRLVNIRDDDAQPLLSEALTPLNEQGKQHIRSKFVETLQSTKAYATAFADEAAPVPESVRAYLNRIRGDEADFVGRSRSFAQRLYSLQTSNMSAGLLCVVGCTINMRGAIGLMKIEREEGAQLELSGREGRRTFMLEMLDNLVFTKNTKLFKAALFAKTGPDPDSIDSAASDNQLGWMAQYWLEFLGCKKIREARVETEGFFHTVMRILNKSDTISGVEKHEAYEALLTEVRSRRASINVPQFVREHIPVGLQDEMRREIRAAEVPNHFDKDITDIRPALKRRVLQTENNIKVLVPIDLDGLVHVGEARLTVNDRLVRVGQG